MTTRERHYTRAFRRLRPLRPIQQCYRAARRHIHFIDTLKASTKEHANRSKAAKRAWRNRRAAK